MSPDTNWQDFPDQRDPAVFWVRWRGKYQTRLWHATADGESTLCHLRVHAPLYVGREAGRCSHCLRAIGKRLAPPEG